MVDINKVLGKGDRLLKASEPTREGDYIEFSVSSEYPVREWYGYEILSHEANAIDLRRVPGMPMLWNHGNGEIGKKPLGVVEGWRVVNGKCRPLVRWAKADYVGEYRQLYEDDILTCFSIGYAKQRAVEIEPASDGTPQVLVTRWEPIEVSLVPDPADPTVGKYRSMDGKGISVEIEVNINSPERESQEEDTETEEMEYCSECGILYKPTMEDRKKCKCQGGTMAIEEVRATEKERQRSIRAMGDKWSRELGPKFADLAETLIDSGSSVEEARSAFGVELERSFGGQKPLGGTLGDRPRDFVPGLEGRDLEQYSLLRAVRSQIPDYPEFKAGCIEQEVSRTICGQIDGDPSKFYFPTRQLPAQVTRAASTQNQPSIISTDLRPDMWIEALRNKAVVFQLGGRFITGLRGNVNFPKETGVITADWINENEPAPESSFTTGLVSLTPKTIASYTTITRTLLLQSSPDAEQIARDQLLKAIALKIDSTAIYGSGVAPVPLGIANLTGKKTLTSGFGNDGGYPTYAGMVELMGLIEADNADFNNLKWLINSKTKARLMVTPVQTNGVEGNFILKDGQTSLIGFPYLVSNQARSTLPKGNGTALSEAILGDWNQLYVGEWEGLSLNVNTQGATFRQGGVELVAFQTLDMAYGHAESFGYLSDIKTAS